MEDKSYLPYNLSRILPFDSTLAAVRDLPLIRPNAPTSEFLNKAPTTDPKLKNDVLECMADILSKAADETERSLLDDEKVNCDEFDMNGDKDPPVLRELCKRRPGIFMRGRREHLKLKKRPRAGDRDFGEAECMNGGNLADTSGAPEIGTPLNEAPTITQKHRVGARTERQESADIIAERDAAEAESCKDKFVEEDVLESRSEERRNAERKAREDSIAAFVECVESCCDALTAHKSYSGTTCRILFDRSILLDLCHSVLVHSEMGIVASVSEAFLLQVIGTLDSAVGEAIREVECIQSKSSDHLKNAVSFTGIQCASAILCLMTQPGIHRGLILEDTLSSVVQLLREVCVRLIFPHYDSTYDIPPPSATSLRMNGNEQVGNGTVNGTDQYDGYAEVDADFGQKQRGLQARPTNQYVGRKVRMDDIMRNSCFLFDHLAVLFYQEKRLSDALVSKAAALASIPINVSDVSSMQLSAYKVSCAVFKSYSQHRGSIVDYVREQLGKVPAARRNLRKFCLSDGRSSVRVSSALLVQLVQAAGGEPVYFGREERMEGELKDALVSQREAVSVAYDIIENILTRSFHDKEAEYRVALQTLFHDLLEMYALPEWPAAEVLLRTLFIQLVKRTRKASTGGSRGDVFSKGMTYELFGALAARIRYVHSIKATPDVHNDETVDHQRALLLSFLRKHAKSDASFGYALQFWQCQIVQACQNEHKQKMEETKEWSFENGCDRSGSSDLESLTLKRYVDLSERIMEAERDGVDRDTACFAASYLSKACGFATRGYQAILEAIALGLNESAPTLRTKSIRALAAIHTVDPSLIQSTPMLQTAVKHSCMDVSSIVRDAALDLLSGSFHAESLSASPKMLAQSPQTVVKVVNHNTNGTGFFEAVYPIVVGRLLDTSTSVRKRALKIMHHILEDAISRSRTTSETPAVKAPVFVNDGDIENRIIDVCTKIVSRLDDSEASVRDLAKRTLLKAMLGCDFQSSRSMDIEGGLKNTAPVLASRMITIFTRLPSASHRRFTSRLLDTATLERVQPLLSTIISRVVYALHKIESQVLELRAEEGDSDTVRQLTDRQVACASILAALANVDASLLVPHCVALAPSVKVVSQTPQAPETFCLNSILFVLEVGIKKMTSVSPSFAADVLQDVEALVCQQPSAIVGRAAVRCLTVVSRNAEGTSQGSCTRLISLFLSFLNSQKKNVALFDATDREGVSNTRVALVRLGLLTRYAKVDDEKIQESFDCLFHYCKETTKAWWPSLPYGDAPHPGETAAPHPFREESIRGLSHFLVANLSFLPKSIRLLQICLLQGIKDKGVDKPNYVSQIRVLTDFQELLMHEEERNSTAGKSHATEGSPRQKVLSAEDDAEAGYLAGCAQTLLPDLLLVASSADKRVRSRVASILGLLVRQGLVLPAAIVPTLFGLVMDQEDRQTRSNALRVITFIAERYPHMLSSGVIGGIDAAYNAAAAAGGREGLLSTCIDAKSGLCVLSPVVSLIPRARRRDIVECLVRMLDPRAILVRKGGKDFECQTELSGTAFTESPRSADPRVSFASPPSKSLRESPTDPAREESVDIDEDYVLKADMVTRECSRLAFYATILATLDYGAAGIAKGSSSSSGSGVGSAASELKLKRAREEMWDVVAAASRIISNSGQVLYEAIKNISKGALSLSKESKSVLARIAIAISLLLQLKRYLKATRLRMEQAAKVIGDAEDIPLTDAQIPNFDVPELIKQSLSLEQREDRLLLPDEASTKQLEDFVRGMKEDKFDDSEYKYATLRSASKKRRRSRRDGSSPTPLKKMQSLRRPSPRKITKPKRVICEDYSDDAEDADFIPP